MQSKIHLVQSKFIGAFCALSISLLMSGCKNYSFSVNEKVLYMPPAIFTDYELIDPQLFACVQQTIYDSHITRAADLIRLNCSNAGIKSLAGLDKFFALKELNLADNDIVDIATLTNLGRMEILNLNANKIKDTAPLLHLLHLKELDLDNNAELICHDLAQLIANQQYTFSRIILPPHCTN